MLDPFPLSTSSFLTKLRFGANAWCKNWENNDLGSSASSRLHVEANWEKWTKSKIIFDGKEKMLE